MKLLRLQGRLDEEKGEALLGLSVQETLEGLLASNLHKQAEQLYRDFRVPDKRCVCVIPPIKPQSLQDCLSFYFIYCSCMLMMSLC